MVVPAQVDFTSTDKKLFHATSTVVSHGEGRVPLDEVTRWDLSIHKMILKGARHWSARFALFDIDTDNDAKVTAGGRLNHPRLAARFVVVNPTGSSQTLFETRCTELLMFSVAHISPKVAERWIHDVLEGGTCRVSPKLSISREGLTLKAMLKKGVTYPWRDYEGYSDEGQSAVLLRSDKKTVKVKVSHFSEVGRNSFVNYGVAPIALRALAHKFGT